jgi:uroporphyrinogen III methyltransferase/synthase
LSELGAECLEYPTISIEPPPDYTALDGAIHNLSSYDWVVFTSVNGVIFFFERLFATGKDVRAISKLRTAAIGPATAGQLSDYGLKSDIVPESYRAESVVEAFGREDITGRKILLPRAEEARPILPVELTKMGATVDEITVYRTTPVADDKAQLIQQLEEKSIDIITFTSSSTVKNFKALIPSKKFKNLMQGVIIASIGPITTDTATALGFDVHITAEAYTIPGLCEAILQFYRSHSATPA